MTPTSPTRANRTRCLLAALAVAMSATATLTLAPSAAGGQGHDAQSVTVPIQDLTFTPSDLTINTGDTVTWVNQDRAPHDVTATSGPAQFASDTLAQGQSFSHTFSAPGAYDYVCTIHPDMVATVTALDHDPAPAAEEASAQDESAPADGAPAAESAPEDGGSEEGAQGAAEPTAAADAPAAASAAPTATALPLPVAASPATTQAVGATQGRQFDPLLIVAGVALGVATLCLLLVTSRATGRG